MGILNNTYGQLRFYSPGVAEFAEFNVSPGGIRFSDSGSSLNFFFSVNGRQASYNLLATSWLHKQVLTFMPGQPAAHKSLMVVSVTQWQTPKSFYFHVMPQTFYRIEAPEPDVISLGMAAEALSGWNFSEIQKTSGYKWRHIQAGL